jgi:hypothetical protein
MSAECPYCLSRIDHCHGTLVRHADSTLECTDPSCVLFGSDRHDLVVFCEVEPDGCSCVVVNKKETADHWE